MIGIAGHRAQEIARILQSHVHLVGGHAIDAAGQGVDVDVVRTGCCVHAVARAVITAAVVGRGEVVVVARKGIGASEGLQHGDRLCGRGRVATGIHCRERPGDEGKVVGAGIRLVRLKHGHAAAVVAGLGRGSGQFVVHPHRQVSRHTGEDRRHRVDDRNGLHVLAGVAAIVHCGEGPQDGCASLAFALFRLIRRRHGHTSAIVHGHHIGSGNWGITSNGGIGWDLGKRRGGSIDNGDDLDVDGLIATIVCDAPSARNLFGSAGLHFNHGGVVVAHGVTVAICC